MLGMGWWVIAAVLSLPAVVGRGKYLLHMAQLEGYRPERYLRWMKRMPSALWERWAAAVWVIGLLVGLLVPGDVVGGIVWVAFAAALSAVALKDARGPAKKPLVWTPRAKRLYACFLGINLVLGLVSAIVGPRLGPHSRVHVVDGTSVDDGGDRGDDSGGAAHQQQISTRRPRKTRPASGSHRHRRDGKLRKNQHKVYSRHPFGPKIQRPGDAGQL